MYYSSISSCNNIIKYLYINMFVVYNRIYIYILKVHSTKYKPTTNNQHSFIDF